MTNNKIFGQGKINVIKKLIDDLGAKKIFLVSGKSSFQNSTKLNEFKAILQKFNCIKFSEFELNPKFEDAIKGVYEYRRFNPDLLISIGGGSVIDMAKIIKILASQTEKVSTSMIKNNKFDKKGIKHIAIPTTSGTGSESTHFAVMYIGEKKYSLSHQNIIPDISLIDPELTYDCPKYLSASAGMDALCQVIESYWSNSSNSKSLKYAEQSIKLILENIRSAVNEKNQEAMIMMAKAANLSGMAINISKTTAPHAISYGITTQFGIPHGHAVALTLGEFFVINSNINNEFINKHISFKTHLRKMRRIYDFFGVNSAEKCRKKWYELMKDIGLEWEFDKMNMKNKSKIQSIIKNVNTERLKNNPILINDEILTNIFSENRSFF